MTLGIFAAIPASEVQTDGAEFTGKFDNRNKDYNELDALTKRMQDMGFQYNEIIRVTNKAIIENLKHGLPAKIKILKFQDRVSVIINGSNVTPALQKVWGAMPKVGKILHMPLEGGVEAYQKTRLMLTQSGEIQPTAYHFGSQVPVKHVREITNAFGNLEKKYGAVTDRIADVGTLSWSGTGPPPIAYTQTIAGGKNRIVFTEENWQLSEKTVDNHLTNMYLDGWTATPGATGVTNHEFGHRIDHYLQDVKGIRTGLPYPRGDFISGVAELNSSQEFAEVFALYESGVAPGNPQVVAMAELLKKGGLIP